MCADPRCCGVCVSRAWLQRCLKLTTAWLLLSLWSLDALDYYGVWMRSVNWDGTNFGVNIIHACHYSCYLHFTLLGTLSLIFLVCPTIMFSLVFVRITTFGIFCLLWLCKQHPYALPWPYSGTPLIALRSNVSYWPPSQFICIMHLPVEHSLVETTGQSITCLRTWISTNWLWQ